MWGKFQLSENMIIRYLYKCVSRQNQTATHIEVFSESDDASVWMNAEKVGVWKTFRVEAVPQPPWVGKVSVVSLDGSHYVAGTCCLRQDSDRRRL